MTNHKRKSNESQIANFGIIHFVVIVAKFTVYNINPKLYQKIVRYIFLCKDMYACVAMFICISYKHSNN